MRVKKKKGITSNINWVEVIINNILLLHSLKFFLYLRYIGYGLATNRKRNILYNFLNSSILTSKMSNLTGVMLASVHTYKTKETIRMEDAKTLSSIMKSFC